LEDGEVAEAKGDVPERCGEDEADDELAER
jgi:hypothetical protein